VENICDSGITKFIEMVVSDSECLLVVSTVSHLQSCAYRILAELRRLAIAVHWYG